MITEKSCGAIVYTCENSTIKYVIIRSKEGIYGFPTKEVFYNDIRSCRNG